jgi:hypothetical protein
VILLGLYIGQGCRWICFQLDASATIPPAGHCHPDSMSEPESIRHGEYKMPGGKLVMIDLRVQDGRLSEVQLSGDFFLEPDAVLDHINAALEGQPADLSEAEVAVRVAGAVPAGATLLGITPEGVAIAVKRALA